MDQSTTKKKAPVGTQRYWESTGQTWIKTHDNTYFDDKAPAWMVVPSIPAIFTDLFRKLDDKGRKIVAFKDPVDGDLWLQNEFKKFETSSGKVFTAADFKQYSMFDKRAASYSFNSELTKRYISDKIELNAKIAETMINFNDDMKTELLRNGEDVGDKLIVLTDEQIKGVRQSVRDNWKRDDSQKLVLEDVHEIDQILTKVLQYLEKGEDFEGDQKTAYEKAKEILKEIELAKYYRPIAEVRDMVAEAYNLVNDNFIDNWGIRESFRKKMEYAFSDYISKYKKQIEEEELETFKTRLGISLYADTDEFYNGLNQSEFFKSIDIKSFTGKTVPDPDNKYKSLILVDYDEFQQKAKYKDLIGTVRDQYISKTRLEHSIRQREYKLPDIGVPLKLRLSEKYKKDLEGNFDINDITLLRTFEKINDYLPEGHSITNNTFTKLRKQNELTDSDNSYAHYSPGDREIYMSSKALSHADIGTVDIHSGHEIASTLIHEIGHAVSQKLGRRGSKEYKKFVVECGWSWEQFQNGANYIATGSDKDIARFGSRNHRKLITEYAHKSPEEAFAEYYSFYSQHKSKIDRYLETDDIRHISKEKDTKYDSSKKLFGEHLKERDFESNNQMHAHLLDHKREIDDHIRTGVLDAYYHNLETTRQSDVLPGHIAYNKRKGVANREEPQPVFTVFDYNTGKHDIVPDSPDAGIHYSNKYLRRLSPTFSISKECFNLLSDKGFNYQEIRRFALSKVTHHKIPNVFDKEQPTSQILHGLRYRGHVIDNNVLRSGKVIFEEMKKIWESDELKKSLTELFLTEENMEKGEEFNELKFKDSMTEAFKPFLDVIKNALSRPSKDGKKYYSDVVLRNEKGEILLMQRSTQDDFMPGKWWLPGGKIDPGEDPVTAAERELFEESGVDMKNKLTFLVKREKPGCSIHYFEAFLDKPFTSILDNEEHYRLQWVSLDDALDNYELLGTKEDLLTLPTSLLSEVESIDLSYPYHSTSITGITYDTLFRKQKAVNCLFNMGQITEDRFLELRKSIKNYLPQIEKSFNKGNISENEYFSARKLVN